MNKNKYRDKNSTEFARELDPNKNLRNEAAEENNCDFRKNNRKTEAASEFNLQNNNRLESDDEFDLDLEFNPRKQKQNNSSRDFDKRK
jgi:TPP-dependent pyruvate/acetoin dehydrogenase alpha subunit